jgi:hypothetical protein
MRRLSLSLALAVLTGAAMPAMAAKGLVIVGADQITRVKAPTAPAEPSYWQGFLGRGSADSNLDATTAQAPTFMAIPAPARAEASAQLAQHGPSAQAAVVQVAPATAPVTAPQPKPDSEPTKASAEPIAAPGTPVASVAATADAPAVQPASIAKTTPRAAPSAECSVEVGTLADNLKRLSAKFGGKPVVWLPSFDLQVSVATTLDVDNYESCVSEIIASLQRVGAPIRAVEKSNAIVISER